MTSLNPSQLAAIGLLAIVMLVAIGLAFVFGEHE